MTDKYYVYLHRRLSDNKPFYVGKGSGRRAWSEQGRNKHWLNTRNKHGICVEILFDGLTENEAFDCEIDAIKELLYFAYPLTNMSTGGEGASYKRSEETKKKMSVAFKGRKHSKETRQRIGKSRSYPTGLANKKADHNKYHFIRLNDNLEFYGTRVDLVQKFNLKACLINGLFKTRKRNIACGWKLKEDSLNDN